LFDRGENGISLLGITGYVIIEVDGKCDYWNGKMAGHAHVKRTYPDVVRMWRQSGSMVDLDLEEG
jgi:hypothetical protein